MPVAIPKHPIDAATLNLFVRGGQNDAAGVAMFSAEVTYDPGSDTYTLTNLSGTGFTAGVLAGTSTGTIPVEFSHPGVYARTALLATPVTGSVVLHGVENLTADGAILKLFDASNNPIDASFLLLAIVQL